jgi:two-component system, NtrC family, sensor kinase
LRRINLSIKLTICLVGGMAAVFTLLGSRIVGLHRRNLEESILEAGDRIGDAAKRSTRHAMLHNRTGDVRQIIDAVGSQPGIDRIRVLNESGEVKFSTDVREVGARLDKSAQHCASCHAPGARGAASPVPYSLSRAERTRIFTDESGRRSLGVINPIENEPGCSSAACHAHPPETRVLGIVDVTMSLEGVDAATTASVWQMTASFVAAGFLLSLAAAALVWAVVQKPVSQLIVGTERVGSGDLDYRIEVSARDELGELAESFNAMTGRLKTAQAENDLWARTLEGRVAEKTAELGRAHEQMVRVEKMASLGKLAAIVAHEINNPLAGILVYARLLLKRLSKNGGGEADAETKGSLETIAAESARCGEIVKGLLQFSRQERADMGPNDLNELIRQSVRLVRHKLDLMNVRAELRLDDSLGAVVCDAQQVRQALVALLINACEAVQPNEGALQVESRRLEGVVEVRVADNGTGMDDGTRQHIFEPFFTTKETGKGTGLGLAIVYGIVHGHSGEIEVESAPGRGTTFLIRLPERGALSEPPAVAGGSDLPGRSSPSETHPPATAGGSDLHALEEVN